MAAPHLDAPGPYPAANADPECAGKNEARTPETAATENVGHRASRHQPRPRAYPRPVRAVLEASRHRHDSTRTKKEEAVRLGRVPTSTVAGRRRREGCTRRATTPSAMHRVLSEHRRRTRALRAVRGRSEGTPSARQERQGLTEATLQLHEVQRAVVSLERAVGEVRRNGKCCVVVGDQP